MGSDLINLLKGALMGVANVIPGVSGGTIALLTGIFERLIRAVRSVDLQALRLLAARDLRGLAEHVDLRFLAAVGAGAFAGILTFARLLDYLFEHQARHVWAFFFGLILASVWFVGRRIRRHDVATTLLFLVGAAAAGGIALLEPAAENTSLPYLMACGAVAMCSMILPGLSGSFVLLLMGNYELIMVDAVNRFDLTVLVPVGLGAVAGLALFARFLAWIFKRFHDQTIALLTGFIFGSLSILWPWKSAIEQQFGDKTKITGYTYAWPEWNGETLVAVGIAVIGMLLISGIELAARKRPADQSSSYSG